MKMYKGTRNTKNSVPTVYVDNEILLLDEAKKIRPSWGTIEWGYRGDGPTNLSVAILLDCLGDENVVRQFYPAFRDAFIVPADYEGFIILEVQIRNWIAKQLGTKESQ